MNTARREELKQMLEWKLSEASERLLYDITAWEEVLQDGEITQEEFEALQDMFSVCITINSLPAVRSV